MNYKQVWLKSRGLFPYTGQPILCEIPGCGNIGGSIHHIDARGMGGSRHEYQGHELIMLCNQHHHDCHFSTHVNIGKDYLYSVVDRYNLIDNKSQ